jgi:hypothetical protein
VVIFHGIPPGGIDTGKPHPARVYDYLLGGRDNYEVDRDTAEEMLAALPRLREAARENRRFLHRAVRTVVEAGIRQIIDIGTGIPTSPNTHEIAHSIAPQTRVLYIDNEPIVQVHAHAHLTDAPNTAFMLADFRETQAILEHPDLRSMIDLTQPTAVLAVALMHFITDQEGPAQCIAALRDALSPGSYLALTHATADGVEDDVEGALSAYRRYTVNVTPRPRAEVLRLFDGFDLVEPGLTTVAQWRPDPGQTDPPRYGVYAGLGVKPGPHT